MKQYRVYRANGSKTGSALSLDFNLEKQSAFLEFAKQKQDDTFDWQNKLSFKLSVTELSKIIVFYKNKTESVKFFHDPSKGKYTSTFKNAILNLTKVGNNYVFKLNQQESNGSLNSMQLSISEEEMYVMLVLFEKAIEKIYF